MMSWDEKYQFLEENGWTVECQSPLEISTKDGSFASGEAANMVLDSLIYDNTQTFNETDMKHSFFAGVNRGVTIACIITKHDLGEEFPTYDEYMKIYKDKE